MYDLLLLNIQCLTTEKFDNIITDYLNLNLKFICLTETWCVKDNITNFAFPGYELMDYYCRSVHRGGGVGIWCKKGLMVQRLNLDKYCSEKNIEVSGVTWTNMVKQDVIVLACYRSPSGDYDVFINNLHLILELIFKPKSIIFLTGDFNVNSLKKNEFSNFSELLASYDLSPKILEPTRISSTIQTVIDQVYTNFSNNCNSAVYDNTISDHRTVLFSMNCGGEKNNTDKMCIKRRMCGSINMHCFNTALSNETWLDTYLANGTEAKFNCFHDTLTYYFNKECPQKYQQIYKKTGKEWVNDVVKESSNNLKDLFFLQKNNPNLKTNYEVAKKQHNKLIKDTKSQFYINKIQNSINVNKSTWHIISELTGKSTDQKNIKLLINDIPTEEPQQISDKFNNFFINISHETLNQNK